VFYDLKKSCSYYDYFEFTRKCFQAAQFQISANAGG